MPTHLVNLDALILRQDFEARSNQPPQPKLTGEFKIIELTPKSITFQILRKPDFQRETANWTPAKISELVQSFLDGDLIPSIIMWRSPETGHIFVIDGAHRLSALIAWVHDDYGDGEISRSFYSNIIPPEQIQAAEETRKLISDAVGSYQELLKAGQFAENSPADSVRRAQNMSLFPVQLQWVHGDANMAEASFFKINQEATPIDSTELIMIQSRKNPNAIAARALLRAGVGHKYWSTFSDETRSEIESIAREIYDLLFIPVLESPIKTLDLPVAGRGYSADSVRLAFEFVNLANGLISEIKPRPKKKRKAAKADDADGRATDKDGSKTIEFLKNVRGLARRISGPHASSLGLHPAVYFYGATGRYQPPAFLATARFIQELEQRNAFNQFTSARKRFEEFLLGYRYFKNQIVGKFGSGTRSLEPLVTFYNIILLGVVEGRTDADIIGMLRADTKLGKTLKETFAPDVEYGKEFSTDTKSQAFLRRALDGAVRCAICGARMHRNSISVDHIDRKQDGGMGTPENAQLAHLYCNSGYKESLHSKSNMTDDDFADL